jgi:hypothetical protein
MRVHPASSPVRASGVTPRAVDSHGYARPLQNTVRERDALGLDRRRPGASARASDLEANLAKSATAHGLNRWPAHHVHPGPHAKVAA